MSTDSTTNHAIVRSSASLPTAEAAHHYLVEERSLRSLAISASDQGDHQAAATLLVKASAARRLADLLIEGLLS